MSISGITLSSGIRGSIVALQSVSGQIQKTEIHLTSGKSVGSALDSPTKFFAAQGLMNRASDIDVRKDSINEGILTIKAAEAGIDAITSVLNSMKAIANGALAVSDATVRNGFAKSYIGMRGQIDQLAGDSRHAGTNLLTNHDLVLNLGEESRVGTLQISGFNASADGLGVGNRVVSGVGGNNPVQVTSFNTYHHLANQSFTDTFAIGNVTQTTVDETLQVTFSNSAPGGFSVGASVASASMQNGTLTVTGSVAQDVPASLPQTVPNPAPPPATITINVPTVANIQWGGNAERSFSTGVSQQNVLEVQVDGATQSGTYTIDGGGNIVFDASAVPSPGQVVSYTKGESWDTTSDVSASLKQVDSAISTLRGKSADLSNTLNIVTTRLAFNDQMSAILQKGRDNLTLADMDQESAELLTLQVRQNVATSSLSMASQADQSVLKMLAG